MRLLLVCLSAFALGGCAAPGALVTATTSAPAIAAAPKPTALTTIDVPPVPLALKQQIDVYTQFRAVNLVNWSGDGNSLLVATRFGNTTQLARISSPNARPEPVTRGTEPVRAGRVVPAVKQLLLFGRDSGGNEAAQIYRLDTRDGMETLLSDPKRAHQLGAFNHAGTHVVMTSVPLDRAARVAGDDELPPPTDRAITTELSLLDAVSGERRVIAQLPATGWGFSDFSADDQSMLATLYRSANDVEVWRVRVADGARELLLPRAGDARAYHASPRYSADGRSVFVISDRSGEFRKLWRIDLATGAATAVTQIEWDVAAYDLSDDRTRIAAITNEAGRGVLRVFDAATLAALNAPRFETSVTGVQWAPDNRRLAVALTSAELPSSVAVIDAEGARWAWWARATGAIAADRFRPTEVIAWTSFDGRRITGLLTRPPASFTGKRPVLINIHGGPEQQARLAFNGTANYLINELGVAYIQPNVRGSTGFGKSFHLLDDGVKREDSVRDIGALLDWIATQPDLDGSRVAVQGGSYGGYMALAVATNYPQRIRASIPSVGISHFVSFLERTESYRRDLRRAEYGDERDPAMRAFFEKISPLANASRIQAPLFVIHGRNDPRVPVQEAEQIVAAVRGNGVPVWSMIGENEGHGFAKRENADYALYARVMFLQRHLLAGGSNEASQ